MNEYAKDWEEYRRLRRNIFLIWLLYIPAVGAFGLIVDYLFKTFAPAFILALAWGLWFIIANFSFAQFSCPRCGQYFAGGPGKWRVPLWIFTRKCRYCGLKKFADYTSE
jgi:hypothetical protein